MRLTWLPWWAITLVFGFSLGMLAGEQFFKRPYATCVQAASEAAVLERKVIALERQQCDLLERLAREQAEALRLRRSLP
jgi:hypothetical protein